MNWTEEVENYKLNEVEIGNIWSKGDNLSKITDDFIELTQNYDFDLVAAIETKGLIFASAFASRVKKPLIIFKKKGQDYYREEFIKYSFMSWRNKEESLEIEKSLLAERKRILVIDDLAYGLNSFKAVNELINISESSISAFLCFANLSDKKQLEGKDILSLVTNPDSTKE